MARSEGKIHAWNLALVVVLFSAFPVLRGVTDPRDIYALNSLYTSLGSPPLPGWISIGGDPCGPPNWQGVECVNANVTSIKLAGANLGGELGFDLGSFASIIMIDLSNNHIGGILPSDLPTTLKSFFLSDNQITGLIPDTISALGQLTDLSLNNNQLSGVIPDAFEQLKELINLDLSGNSLVGQLPSSMGNLSVLTTLRLQSNQLSGILNVLQDLPLTELNIENNLFSGPIPEKLLFIPNFRSAGNPFNTTILPSPPASPPILSPSEAPSSEQAPEAYMNKPSIVQLPESGKENHKNTNKLRWIAIFGFCAAVVLGLGLCFFMIRYCRKNLSPRIAKSYDIEKHEVALETSKRDQYLREPSYRVEKVKGAVLQQGVRGSQKKNTFSHPGKDHTIGMAPQLDSSEASPCLPQFPTLPDERTEADLISIELSPRRNGLDSTKCFTVASLQQYTNSFSQENLIGKGTLGTVYRAQLPDGKVLAVKRLDKPTRYLTDGDFLELVSSISKLQHTNIVEFVGYCVEHGQRLLVYSYCSHGTLKEALHLDIEMKKKLSWNVRMQLVLQTAKALEYLHEVHLPPVMHQNFKSANILLNEDLSVKVSDSGLAHLLPADYMIKLQGYGYGAPELETGSYSHQSDVYSFGVVMLEILTGRTSYDRSRPRGSQYLARWALSQLYDIDALSRMVDPFLNGAYPSKSLSRLADIITLCIQPEPEFRPPMSEIVQQLIHLIQTDL